LEHHRLNSRHHLGNALTATRIRCFAALLAGLLIVAGNAAAAALWVANAGSRSLIEFPGKLKSSKARVFNNSNLDAASTIAFHGGNLWVTNFNTNQIFEFTPSQFKKAKKFASASPVVVISQDIGVNLSGPEGIVFDGSGNMWVGAETGPRILVYTPAQYAATGNPTPNIILNTVVSFSSPSHIAFDGGGNLWVVDEDRANGNGGAGEVFKYSNAQIAVLTAGTHNIDPVFGIGINAFSHLEGLAFDGGGNMWLADESGNNVYKFAASDLTGLGLSQNVTPSVVLGASAGGPCGLSLHGPYGIAIDGSGNLFVSNANSNGGCVGSLAEFSASTIGSTGNPVPKKFLTTHFNSPNNLTFGPTF
jgi:sugar lactone lactonase YvrE